MATRREQTRYEFTATDQASQVFRQVERSANNLRGAYSSLSGAIGGLISAGALVGAVRAAQQAEQSQNRLAAVIKATGGAAGIASEEYERLADAMMETTQFDDESIRQAQSTLVKFGNIHGTVFRNALRLSADLAAFMGSDIPDAAQMLGRSLQSPTEGLTMMERQFGKLTKAEEENIKALVEQGRAIEAQNAVLALWEKKVGGAAAAMNTGLTRSLGDVRKQWNELLETMGKSGRVLDSTLSGAATLLKDVRLEMEDVRTPMTDLAETTLEWIGYLRLAPGFIGMIGQAAVKAREDSDRARRTKSGKIRQMDIEDIQGFESGMSAYRPIELGGGGGKSEREKELERLRELAAKSATEDLLAQEKSLEARDDIIRADAQREKKERERLELLGQESAAADLLAQERSLQERDDILRESRLGELKKKIEEAERASLRFDMALNTAFDRAVRGAEDLSDVLKNLIEELAMIELQKRVFEPLSKALSKGLDEVFGEIFGGAAGTGGDVEVSFEGRASGGPVRAGVPYMVGEDGPELFVPGQGGTIVAGGGGGVSIVQHIQVDSRSDRASIIAAMVAAKEQAKAEIAEAMNRGSRMFSPR